MSMMDSDRRLEELRGLHEDMRAVEMPSSMAHEIDQLSERLIAAADLVEGILDRIAAVISLLRGLCDCAKDTPAADRRGETSAKLNASRPA